MHFVHFAAAHLPRIYTSDPPRGSNYPRAAVLDILFPLTSVHVLHGSICSTLSRADLSYILCFHRCREYQLSPTGCHCRAACLLALDGAIRTDIVMIQ